MTPNETLQPQMERAQHSFLFVGIIALAISLIGLFSNPAHFWQSYLFGYIFWSGIALGCLGIFFLHNVVGGNWGVVIRRFVESGLQTLPLVALFVIPIFFGMNSLYSWTHADVRAHDFAVGHKAVYMNVPFFIGRTVFYFLIWFFFGYRILRMANEHDRTGDPALFRRIKGASAPALLLFVLTTSYAFIDWIMSLEPDWFSTIYGWMFTVGEVLLTFSFLIALLVLFSKYEPIRSFVTRQALSRPRKSDAGLHHALGLHVVRAVPHHLGRKPAGRDSLVRAALQRRLGLYRVVPSPSFTSRPLLPAAHALHQEESRICCVWWPVWMIVLRITRCFLDCRTGFPATRTRSLLDRYRRS